MVSGTGMLIRCRPNNCPKIVRICSKRSTISFAFLSVVSVMTTKCAERYSCHLSFCSEAARAEGVREASKHRVAASKTREELWHPGRENMRVAAMAALLSCYHGGGAVSIQHSAFSQETDRLRADGS